MTQMPALLLKSALLGMAIVVAGSAGASTWNAFNWALNEDFALYFFDADTVVKQGEDVTLLVKFVRTKTASSDGSWQFAIKYVISCPKRTDQILKFSAYARNGNFIRSRSAPPLVMNIRPDSIMGAMHEAICTPGFPWDPSDDLYFPISDNDPMAHTRRFIEHREGQKKPGR